MAPAIPVTDLVLRCLVLHERVPGVVLVFVGLCHGVRGRVHSVEDDKAGNIEGPHWAGNGATKLLSEKRHF